MYTIALVEDDNVSCLSHRFHSPVSYRSTMGRGSHATVYNHAPVLNQYRAIEKQALLSGSLCGLDKHKYSRLAISGSSFHHQLLQLSSTALIICIQRCAGRFFYSFTH